MSRKESGYLWGDDILDFANVSHYQRALSSTKISDEEYWYQSVFHGPTHAKNLTKEIFQKNVRNNISSLKDQNDLVVTSRSDINSNIRREESLNKNKYTSVVDISNNEHLELTEPGSNSKLLYTLAELISLCDDNEIKVIAYFLVKSKLDNLIISESSNYKFKELDKYIIELWSLDFNCLTPYKFLGTRYRYEVSLKTLRDKIKNNFSDLLSSL